MSRPRRTPPSTQTSVRPPTAATTSASASTAAWTRSSWRPPWLLTTIASAPCSTASRASSAVRIPLRTSGRPDQPRISARSSQVRDVACCNSGSPVGVAAVRRADLAEVAERRAARTRIADPARGSRAPAGRPSGRSRRYPAAAARSTSVRRPRGVGLDVELEPARRVGRRGGDLLDRARRRRGQDVRHAGRGRAARRRQLRRRGGRGPGPPSARSATGIATGTPSMVVDGSTDETSTRTRGRNRRRRQAASFSSRVISSQEPPAT